MHIPNLLLNCQSGSHAYGLATETSDEDFRGVFFADKADFYAGTATTQIRKARGLNKKVHNPMPKERKSVEDFYYVVADGKSLPLST